MKRRSLIYANIGCRSGVNEFPSNACEELIRSEACDAFIFVEASTRSADFIKFYAWALDKGFRLFVSDEGQNQVIIGVKKDIAVNTVSGLGQVSNQAFKGRGLRANGVNSSEVVPPNYLKVSIDIEGRPLNLIGSRIPSYSYYDNDGRIMQKAYNAASCSFCQLIEALDRDIADWTPTILLIDGNNARYLGKFTDDYDAKIYQKVAQRNFNFPILRSEIQKRGLVLFETKNDYSFGPSHDDHCFANIPCSTMFFSCEAFDHKAIRVTI